MSAAMLIDLCKAQKHKDVAASHRILRSHIGVFSLRHATRVRRRRLIGGARQIPR